MSTESIDRKTVVATGILAFFVLSALCIRHNIPIIEEELGDRATRQLRDQRMGWAEIELNGRDLTISGVAPDDQAREHAAQIAAVYGVRVVDNQLRTVVEFVSEPAPDAAAAAQTARSNTPVPAEQTADAPVAAKYRSRITVSDNGVVLDGAVADETTRRLLVQKAQALFGVAGVEARLRVEPGAPPGFADAAYAGLDIAQRLVIGEVLLDGTSVQVSGMTGTDEGEAYVRESLAQRLPANYSGYAETSTRAGLEAVLRTSPGLAERLSKRTAKQTTAPPDPASVALSLRQCAAQFESARSGRRVLFATASATLTGESEQLLRELGAVLKRCPGHRLSIEGHTDDQGLIENNLALSQRRAEAVMQFMVANGVSLSRLSARGYGESTPLVPNETAADRAINRRIEFVFEGI